MVSLTGRWRGWWWLDFLTDQDPGPEWRPRGRSPRCALLRGDSWAHEVRWMFCPGHEPMLGYSQHHNSCPPTEQHLVCLNFLLSSLAQGRQHTLGNRSDKPRPPIGPRLRVQIFPDPQPHAKKWAQDWHSLRPSQPVLPLGTNNSTQMKVQERYPPSCAEMSPKVRGDKVSHWPCQWKARPSGMVDGQVM